MDVKAFPVEIIEEIVCNCCERALLEDRTDGSEETPERIREKWTPPRLKGGALSPALVCKRWYHTVMSSSRLWVLEWGTITLPCLREGPSRNPAQLLEESSNCDIDIMIGRRYYYDDKDAENLRKLLLPYSCRWRKVTMNMRPATSRSLSAIFDPDDTFLRLTVLNISSLIDYPKTMDIRASLPSLRSLAVTNQVIRLRTTTIPILESLTLIRRTRIQLYQEETLQILLLYPNLQYLNLDGSLHPYATNTFLTVSGVSLCSLTTLIICTMLSNAISIINKLIIPRLQCFQIVVKDKDDMEAVVAAGNHPCISFPRLKQLAISSESQVLDILPMISCPFISEITISESSSRERYADPWGKWDRITTKGDPGPRLAPTRLCVGGFSTAMFQALLRMLDLSKLHTIQLLWPNLSSPKVQWPEVGSLEVVDPDQLIKFTTPELSTISFFRLVFPVCKPSIKTSLPALVYARSLSGFREVHLNNEEIMLDSERLSSLFSGLIGVQSLHVDLSWAGLTPIPWLAMLNMRSLDNKGEIQIFLPRLHNLEVRLSRVSKELDQEDWAKKKV